MLGGAHPLVRAGRRHADVGQHHVGPMGFDRGQQRVVVVARGDDLQVVLPFQQPGHALAHQVAVLGKHHLGRHAEKVPPNAGATGTELGPASRPRADERQRAGRRGSPRVHQARTARTYALGADMEGPERQTGVHRSAARGQPFRRAVLAAADRRRATTTASPPTLGRTLMPARNPVCGCDTASVAPLTTCRSLTTTVSPAYPQGLSPFGFCLWHRAAVVGAPILRPRKAHVKGYFPIHRVFPRLFWLSPGLFLFCTR
jgi:hypothetical protein